MSSPHPPPSRPAPHGLSIDGDAAEALTADEALAEAGRQAAGFILLVTAIEGAKEGRAAPDVGHTLEGRVSARVADWIGRLAAQDPLGFGFAQAVVWLARHPGRGRQLLDVLDELSTLHEALQALTGPLPAADRKIRHQLAWLREQVDGPPRNDADELLEAAEAGWFLAELGRPLVDALVQEGRHDEAEVWLARSLATPGLDDRRRQALLHAGERLRADRARG